MQTDLEPIKAIAVATELFTVDEVGIFDEMFNDSLDRLWNLYFLGVSPDQQGTGGGRALVGAVENDLISKGSEQARVLLVETSGLPSFKPTRDFYEGLGFDEEARIRQFYGPDDDKVVYWKSILK